MTDVELDSDDLQTVKAVAHLRRDEINALKGKLAAALTRVARLEACLQVVSMLLAPGMGEECPYCTALLMDHDDHAKGCTLVQVFAAIDAALEVQP